MDAELLLYEGNEGRGGRAREVRTRGQEAKQAKGEGLKGSRAKGNSRFGMRSLAGPGLYPLEAGMARASARGIT